MNWFQMRGDVDGGASLQFANNMGVAFKGKLARASSPWSCQRIQAGLRFNWAAPTVRDHAQPRFNRAASVPADTGTSGACLGGGE
jgi:hypothetical protein